jgi:hypothetical protein
MGNKYAGMHDRVRAEKELAEFEKTTTPFLSIAIELRVPRRVVKVSAGFSATAFRTVPGWWRCT